MKIAGSSKMEDNLIHGGIPHPAFPTPLSSHLSGLVPAPLHPGHLMTSYPGLPGPPSYPFPPAGHFLPLPKFYPMPPMSIKSDPDSLVMGPSQHPMLSSQMGYLPPIPPGYLPPATPNLLSPISAVSDPYSTTSDPSASEPDSSTDIKSRSPPESALRGETTQVGQQVCLLSSFHFFFSLT